MKRVLLALSLVVGTVVFGSPAHAFGPSVTLVAGTLTVTADGTEQFVTVTPNADGSIHVSFDQTEQTITGGPATVNNVDTISIDGGGGSSGHVGAIFDLSAHALEPGQTPDPSGISEIETSVTGAETLTLELSSKSDKVRMGTNGINLNNDDDVDITPTLSSSSVPTVYVYAGRGNNVISAHGDAVTGAPLAWDVSFGAKGGRDRLIGGQGPDGDDLYGGGGNDFLDGGGGSHNDRDFGGHGFDTCRRGQRHSCEA